MISGSNFFITSNLPFNMARRTSYIYFYKVFISLSHNINLFWFNLLTFNDLVFKTLKTSANHYNSLLYVNLPMGMAS